MSAEDARWCLANGVDLVPLGRAGILARDAPRRVRDDPDWAAPDLPVSAAALRREGVGDDFVDYLRGFGNFMAA